MKKNLLKKILTNLDAIITASTLTVCVILVNVNVIMRYVAKSPIQWCEEVVTSLFVWTVFIGSAYAYRKHAHLGVDIVVNRLNGKARTVVEWTMSIIELAVLIMLTIISSQYVYHLLFIRGHFKPTLTDLLRIPKAYTGIAVPIGFGLSAIYSIYFFLTDRFHIIKRKAAVGSEHQVEGGNF